MIEQPNYELIHKEGPFELRRYQAFTMIEASDRDLKSYQGFRLAFDFIQGENQNHQKISMTTPVVNNMNNEGIQTTAFVMPPKMKHDEVPLPSNQMLKKVLVPERVCAVYRFSLNPKMTTIRKYETNLREWIVAQGYSVLGELQLARYNPPFIPGFLKRNELWIEVKSENKT